MKKICSVIAAAVLAAGMSVPASAHSICRIASNSTGMSARTTSTARCGYFVDSDGDGICDNCADEECMLNCAGGHRGVCVDSNGDGICDCRTSVNRGHHGGRGCYGGAGHGCHRA